MSIKHKRILMLMVVSQVLLILFVLQWLSSQYINEKNRLTRELTTFYIEAQDDMVDTLLFRSYVSPVLSHSVRSTEIMDTQDGDRKQITVSVLQGPDTAERLNDTIRIRRRTNDMLLRSVKMIISHSDSVHREEPIIRELGIKPDTSAFKAYFHRRLADAGMEFNFAWISDQADHPLRRKIYLAPVNPFSLPAVSVGKYRSYVASKILPQVLFGILLVCLTALAFMLAWRSLRNHAILDKLRNEFISNMTHELKTPVASISIALESLSKFNPGNDPSIRDEYLRLARSETGRLEDLVNRVLDHSMLEGDQQILNLEETNINSLIAGVVSTMQTRLNDKGYISFQEGEKELLTKCDPLLLKGVIMNLIDNGIKYCDTTPEITITSSFEDRKIKIVVADNGPGISPDYQDKIFEKFFRVPSGNIHNVKGYGLGLSYALDVINLHNGSIWVQNLAKGCAFTIYLPLQ